MALQDAMSRQAHTEREKQACHSPVGRSRDRGEVCRGRQDLCRLSVALQLRAMNIIYETTKERGTTILIPTSMSTV